MKLRTKLFQLGVGTVVLPLVLAAVLGGLLVEYERDAFRLGALQRNRAFMTAVDTELRGHIATLRGLATSKNLEANDLRAFHDDALRVLKSQPDWQAVILSLPSGQQVINTLRAPGASLPSNADKLSSERLLQSRLPVAGNIIKGSISQKYGIPVRVPILRSQGVAYMLTAVIEPEAFARLLMAQQLPPSWVSGLIDNTGHFVARIPPRSPDLVASRDFLQAVEREPQGWYRGRTVEGNDTFTAHIKSGLSGWSMGMAIPAGEVNAAAYRAGWFVGLGAFFTLVATFGIAYWMALRIAQPIAALAAAARAVGSDQVPDDLLARPAIDEVGDVARALREASHAIHDRQQLIEREQAILKATNQSKDEFLAMLGHELRNPLSAVTNASLMLNRADLSAENRAAAQAIIVRQTEQLTRLVNDLLDVGRVVSGKIRLEKTPLEIGAMARAAVDAIAASGRSRSHRIVMNTPAAVYVNGDVTRLEQVVSNLVLNAVAHTPANGSIEISTALENGRAVLRVTDTGEGLKAGERENIFELFYQGDTALHRKGGLGIGLTLVKRLVELHEGTVTASSAGPQQGATFTLTLPALDAPPVAGPARAPVEQLTPPLDILVVDDNDDVRNSLRLLLEFAGHTVHEAANGPAGFREALAKNPAVALLDIGMPGMDGYELARRIRSEYEGDIALIAMTGYGQAEDVLNAIDAGFDAHLVKPADPAALNQVLARLGRKLRRSRQPPPPGGGAGPGLKRVK